ncbi:LLM class F420-dependent oxidoreductase [Asanoa ishikariensis]|uniref:Probable F420-dependent oxidoreductase, Rv1855c family n=1 Tax=Asanoa ishikariensis TaxID=137265 RepID=A0A1H3RP14_9ACTN|nr:LLM class F420-dependent oxidoreductase [Asanoa ishikariensis]GIF67002.1 LLM class F420-dependent oxidoreductase [Asanoa ishikariensis]SDZ27370.1 probable F420-dependent oxidoreductase, Rv1855c family [Asanoa ishikariensis]
MRLCIFTEPQLGASYADQVKAARTTEAAGFDGYFRSDHYLTMGGDGLPGPTDSWVTLAGLALETSTIRLGTLVTSATFRHPGPLAISVAQVDEMSGGRIELGLGAGWYDAEHQAYAIPFPSVGERFDRLTEQLEILTSLWATPVGERLNYAGKYYSVVDSPALPKPAQSPRPPIIIGGSGPKRTPALAARFADEFNVPFRSAAEVSRIYRGVDDACVVAGRTDLPVKSAAVTVVSGRTDAEVRARWGTDVLDTDSGDGAVIGTPNKIVNDLGAYVEAGATRLFLQMRDLRDIDLIELIAAEIAPQLA